MDQDQAQEDPVLQTMRERNKPFYEGRQAGRDAIAANGIDAARATLDAVLPPGKSCALPIADFRYWSGFRAAIQESADGL
jgi:hypothetical protein